MSKKILFMRKSTAFYYFVMVPFIIIGAWPMAIGEWLEGIVETMQYKLDQLIKEEDDE